MPDICTVLWGFCKREHVAATWLHFPYTMVLVKLLECFLLVRLGNLSPSQLLPSCSENKDHPCLVNRGWVWDFNSGQTLVRASIFCGKAGDWTNSKARLYFHTTLFWLCSIGIDVWVSSRSQIRITSTIKHQFWKTETCQLCRFSLQCCWQASCYLTEYTG